MVSFDRITTDELKIFSQDKTKSSLFKLLDRTITVEGEDFLQKIFHTPLLSIDEINDFNKLISNIINDINNWRLLQSLLSSDEYIFIKKNIESQLLFKQPIFPFAFVKSINTKKLNVFFNTIESICRKIINSGSNLEIIQKLHIVNNYFICNLSKRRNEKFFFWIIFSKNYKNLIVLLNTLHKIDALVSIAITHIDFSLVFPKWIINYDDWYINDLRNLLLEEPVSNSINIKKDKRIIFLSGANMSGKSTFLLSLGQALYLAKCGFGIPASDARLPFFENVFTSFEASTNIEQGLSFFGSEIKRSVDAINKAKESKFLILLLDEIYKGTNIVDSSSCLKFFINNISKKNLFCVISTHLLDTVNFYQNTDYMDFYCFEGIVTNEKISFSYKIKKGVSFQKLGCLLLEREYSKASVSKVD